MRTFVVALDIYMDAETGASHILPSEKQLDADEREIAGLKEEADALAASDDAEERSRAKALLVLQARLSQALARKRRARANLIQQAEHREYRLRAVTYGRYVQAERVAKRPDHNDEIVTDQSLLMEELLPGSVEGLTPDEVKELPPNIAAELWQRLRASMFPSEQLLPFSATP